MRQSESASVTVGSALARRAAKSAVPIAAVVGDNAGMADADFLAWLDGVAATVDGCAAPLAVAALPAEASTRRFYRITAGAATFVAMHAPPATEDNPRYLRLAALLRGYGLATPAIHAADVERGYLLLEDLGFEDLEAAYARGEVAGPLAAALKALARLQAIPADAHVGDIEPYTLARFEAELGIFTEWLVERMLQLPVAGSFEDVRQALLAATQSVPQCVVHRDFHCRNLIWRGDTVGIVDFQDALVGPCCYDLASLLRDCYHVFDEPTVAVWRQRFFALAKPACDEALFARAFDLAAIQRQLKAVGIFARLYLARDRRSHLGDIVPVLERIAALAANYAETKALAQWLRADVVPAASRRLQPLTAAA